MEFLPGSKWNDKRYVITALLVAIGLIALAAFLLIPRQLKADAELCGELAVLMQEHRQFLDEVSGNGGTLNEKLDLLENDLGQFYRSHPETEAGMCAHILLLSHQCEGFFQVPASVAMESNRIIRKLRWIAWTYRESLVGGLALYAAIQCSSNGRLLSGASDVDPGAWYRHARKLESCLDWGKLIDSSGSDCAVGAADPWLFVIAPDNSQPQWHPSILSEIANAYKVAGELEKSEHFISLLESEYKSPYWQDRVIGLPQPPQYY